MSEEQGRGRALPHDPAAPRQPRDTQGVELHAADFTAEEWAALQEAAATVVDQGVWLARCHAILGHQRLGALARRGAWLRVEREG